MNVVVFIPYGFLLGCSFGRMKWWRVFPIGLLTSVIIETIQYVFMRGFADFDDVFHNMLGCMIGWGMSVGVEWMIRRSKIPDRVGHDERCVKWK